SAGASVCDPVPDSACAPADTDLGRLQRSLLDPALPRVPLAGDGSFLLLEADTPVEAAELAASALLDRPLSSSTLVVAGEGGALDAALFRQGLPTLGLSESSRFRPHLQPLPLRLALAFRPRDPFRAAELLLLPGAPLPSQARRKLLDALNEMPGIGSPAWREAVEEAIAQAVERAREGGAKEPAAQKAGQDLAGRIEDWFSGEDFDPQEGITGAKAAGLCAMVAHWAGARSGGADEDENALEAGLWAHAAAVARTLQRILAARPPGERLSQLALAQLHDLAVGDGSGVADFDGEAGRPALCSAPGAVLAGVATTLWFGFVQDVGGSPAPEPWTSAEQSALAAAGVHLPAPGATRRFEAWGWRRPLLAAREQAVLVRWRLAGAKPVAPHAFLDELRMRVAPGSIEACSFGSERLLVGAPAPFASRTEQLAPAAPIVPQPVWTVPAATLRVGGSLSASQLEALLGCPFKWALSYQAQLRPGKGVDLPADNRLLGDFAHRILQDMLLGDEALDAAKASEADATAWAARTFDARVAAEAAPLVRPGREVERDAARTLVSGAAAALLRHVKAGGWEPLEAEDEVSGTFAGKPVAGRIDLVLEKNGKPALLDLKLSGGKYRREELEKGRALQLALYAGMLRTGGKALPPAGFLTLDDGQLLTVNPQAFPGAVVIDGPSAQETLAGAEVMFKAWEKVFAKGLLPVCSEDLEWEDPVVAAAGPLPDDELARRDPPCRFCAFTTMCQVTVGQEVSP
ncbi:MAG: PD-(D/E)XK nuclease family protein, partial [Anaeromyxobacteraceae bacterium]